MEYQEFIEKAKECIVKLENDLDLNYRIEQFVINSELTFEVEVDRNFIDGCYDEEDNFIENPFYGSVVVYHFSILKNGEYVESVTAESNKYNEIDLKYLYNCAVKE